MKNYKPLYEYLRHLPYDLTDRTLSFSEIERILGSALPPSAHKHRAWWDNPRNTKDHRHAQSWLAAGWKVDSVDMPNKKVGFRRVRLSAPFEEIESVDIIEDRADATPSLELSDEPDTIEMPERLDTEVSPPALEEPERAEIYQEANGETLLSGYLLPDAIIVANIAHQRIEQIEPRREPDGKFQEFMPQAGYDNVEGLPLHKYGAGPFCKFTIDSHHRDAGVYLLTIDGEIEYIGECENLASRFNMGYGNISPRNCYVGGQSTNCKVNNNILRAVQSGANVVLWFYETAERKLVERKLLEVVSPPWNRSRAM